MAYSKQKWKDGKDGDTPISAKRLNHMEDGIKDAYDKAGDAKDGKSATVEVDSVETVKPDDDAEVSNEGDETGAKLKFKIPQGKKGSTGKALKYSDMSDDNIDDLSSKIVDKLKNDSDFVDDVADKVNES